MHTVQTYADSTDYRRIQAVQTSYPVSMNSAVFDKVIGDVFGSPRQLSQTWMYLLVQKLYSLFEQAAITSQEYIHVLCNLNNIKTIAS